MSSKQEKLWIADRVMTDDDETGVAEELSEYNLTDTAIKLIVLVKKLGRGRLGLAKFYDERISDLTSWIEEERKASETILAPEEPEYWVLKANSSDVNKRNVASMSQRLLNLHAERSEFVDRYEDRIDDAAKLLKRLSCGKIDVFANGEYVNVQRLLAATVALLRLCAYNKDSREARRVSYFGKVYKFYRT